MFPSPCFRSLKSTLGRSSAHARRSKHHRRNTLPVAALIEILEARQLLSASALPMTIAGSVSSTLTASSLSIEPTSQSAANPAGGITAFAMRQAYGVNGSSLNGSGQTIAIVEEGYIPQPTLLYELNQFDVNS